MAGTILPGMCVKCLLCQKGVLALPSSRVDIQAEALIDLSFYPPSSFTVSVNCTQVDPTKSYEVLGNTTYDELGQRIAAEEAVLVQGTNTVYKVLSFYKTVSKAVLGCQLMDT